MRGERRGLEQGGELEGGRRKREIAEERKKNSGKIQTLLWYLRP